MSAILDDSNSVSSAKYQFHKGSYAFPVCCCCFLSLLPAALLNFYAVLVLINRLSVDVRMQHLVLARLLSVKDDKGKISSLCWFLSLCSKAGLHCSSLWFAKKRFGHCALQRCMFSTCWGFFCAKLLFGNPRRVSHRFWKSFYPERTKSKSNALTGVQPI